MSRASANPTAAAGASSAIDPAAVYESRFVPALFRPASPAVADAAGVGPGQTVLDIGCGTGALARWMVGLVGPDGQVVGLDPNPAMLTQARRSPEPVTWVDGRAEALPFDNGRFDAAASQFALMFFDNPETAVREALRVLRPGGRLAMAVCAAVTHSGAYADLSRLLRQRFGSPVADAFGAPFALGDAARLQALGRAGGLAEIEVRSLAVTARFASVDALIDAEQACIWTLGGLLNAAQVAELRHTAPAALARHVDRQGRVAFRQPLLALCGTRPS